MSHINDEGEEMYNGFKNILEKVKSAKDLEKFIDQPDKSKYQYASKVAYMYLKWVTIGWDDYMDEADPDEVWDEYMSNINFDQFSDYCEEFVDFLDDVSIKEATPVNALEFRNFLRNENRNNNISRLR